MRRLAGSWIFLLVLLVIDIYVFQALKAVADTWTPRTKLIVFGLYWGVSVLSIALMLGITFTNYESWHRLLRTYAFAIVIGLFLAKLLASMFFLIDDVRRVVQWVGSLFVPSWNPKNTAEGTGITRSMFLSWAGLAVGGGLFTSLLYGFGNKYKYNLQKIALTFAHLPEAFKGFKIIHVSDIHSGSFTDKEAVMKGIEKINAQKADVVLFTGDLVNYHADEMKDYMDVFSKLEAKHGVYATLGNHDYGFPTGATKEEVKQKQLANAAGVVEVHRKLGWKTLSNEHVELERNGEKIAILGVDNTSGKMNFPSFGRLPDTHAAAKDIPFKILMSHDPSHWNHEITPNFKDIALTLSGHTHGMQFGVELPGFRWSPVKYVYKQWAGLYEEAQQKLYVNRGFGFIGYPGRVGILPEITLIELT
ncbi:metallophosphoesterase [Lacibacter luteus]|uniref:Metallophosphoesterase n=1 Tax=Lacibacter luteus TaxID=2508719 RepID=A0A4Q1CNV1_9BACT|nr:metallophosphoesterase [Lacibacter luteus]RXK62401.1 metallophosphoesterase [Lacibacter luteus]